MNNFSIVDAIIAALELEEFILDNSTLNIFALCPRKFLYRKILQLRPVQDSLALSYGSAFHEGLAEFYTSGDYKKALEAFAARATDEKSKMLLKISDAAAANIKEEHTLEFGLSHLAKYMTMFPTETESFKIMKDSDDKPMVEVGFNMHLANGTVVGKMDGVIDDGDLLEHKTTSMYLSTDFLSQYSVHNQITLYMAALREMLGKAPRKCIVNVIRVFEYKRDTGKDSKLYSRQFVSRTPAQLDQMIMQLEFRINQIKNFLRVGFDAFYQNAPEACTHKFHTCEFMPLCQAQDEQSVSALMNGGQYIKEEWEPYDVKGARKIVDVKPKMFEA